MLKLNRILFALVAALVAVFPSAAQNVTITGTVLDETTEEPLIGVSVMVKGSSRGTMTDVNGRFNILADPNSSLSFSYVGYLSQDVELKGERDITVLMVSTSEELDELVVIGYGVQRKSDITGSISSVSGKDVNDVPVSSALQALQGKAAGVSVIQNTGSPGSKTTIQIRGVGTINDSDPLYVVDGFIVDNIDYINPNDIANVEIFKDAASSAVYGARAANGVVSITTKQGEEGKTRISFDSYVGFSTPWKEVDVMNLEEYALARDYMDGLSQYSADGRLYYSKDAAGNYYFDDYKYHRLDTIRQNSPGNWWDAVKQTGIKQQYNLSVSGGNERVKYMLSTSYYKETGIVKTSDYRRFNARLNVSTELAKWLHVTANMAYVNEDRDPVAEGSASVLKSALSWSPLQYTYNSVGYWNGDNPLALINRDHQNITSDRFDLNLTLDADIFKWLNYQFKVSYYVEPEDESNFWEVNKLDTDFTIPSDVSRYYEKHGNTNKWEINNLLTFNWSNKVHSITVLAGQTAEGYKYDWTESYKRGTPSNDDNYHYLSSGYTGAEAYGLLEQWTAVGFIGRLNYDLYDRYLLQANVRADASSIFSKDNRWGVFPSVSLGWKFSNEAFMEGVDWLSMGKLRAGWGILGNNRIDELSRYTIVYNQYNYPFGIGNHVLFPGAASTTIGNPDISWEKTKTYNVGLDLGFMKNSLNFTIEYFDKRTSDILLEVPTVASAGLESDPMVNAGEVRNWGLEFNGSYKKTINKFSFEVGFNISWIKNEVTGLGTGNEPVYGAYLSEGSIIDYVTKTEVGRPIGSFYGYVTDGIFNSYEEVMQSAQYEPGKNATDQSTRPGDFRFKDLNGDNRITAEDRTFLGSPLPDIVFGLPITMSYGDFDLYMFFQGQVGNEIFNVMNFYLYNGAQGNLAADAAVRHWSGQLQEDRAYYPLNLNGDVPDLDPSDTPRNFRASDFYVEDGSYVRLKELRLTYNLPKKLISKWKLSNCSVSLSAYNLLTFTGYSGLDPEVGKVIGTESNNINMGVDHGNYPQARTFTIGLKIGL